MKPSAFTYHDPRTVDELVGLLGSLEDAKLLAGGQSLMPMINLRLAQPDHLIDLNTVADLDGLTLTDDRLHIGAMVRQADLMRSGDVQSHLPVMNEALRWVGHFQTRSRGTIGGSMSHLDPTAELPAVALLYDAELTVIGPDGSRAVPMREWPVAYLTPNLAEDEILTSISFRPWPEQHGYAFEEFARRHGDFAIVAVGALLAIDNGIIRRAAVSIAGVRTTPQRLSDVEDALVGQPAVADTFRNAAALASQIEAMTDSYTSGRYRQRLAGVMTNRALTKAAGRAGGSF